MDHEIVLEKLTSPADREDFARLAENETVMSMNMGRAFTPEETEGYFSYLLDYTLGQENAGGYKLRLGAGGPLVGIGTLWVKEDGTELDYMLLPEYWGRGYGTQAALALLDLARKNPGVTQVTGIVDPGNVRSKRVLEKAGFVFDRAIDVEEDGSRAEVYIRGI